MTKAAASAWNFFDPPQQSLIGRRCSAFAWARKSVPGRVFAMVRLSHEAEQRHVKWDRQEEWPHYNDKRSTPRDETKRGRCGIRMGRRGNEHGSPFSFQFRVRFLGPMARVGGLDSLWLGTLKWSDFQMRIRDSYHRAVRVVLCLSLFPSQPSNRPLLSSRLFNT
jgi:hypothetical protein